MFMNHQSTRKTRISDIGIVLILFSLFFITSNRAPAFITVVQSDVQEVSDRYITQFLIMNTTAGVAFRTAHFSYDFVELSNSIADLGIGYSGQEIWDAFSVTLTGPPEGEIFNGWSVSKEMVDKGRFSINHGSGVYDIWTAEDDFNELAFTLSIDKKYFGPDHKLAMNPYEIWGPGMSVITEDDEVIQHDTYGFKVVAVPEPYSLILIGFGAMILKKRRV